ncbi:EamA family transporter [Marinobacterium aestuariivivens]|uniref:EamA family transporter n=1 Tax=Marinobacterium aestuariivivens TaxID=1698799 RepID=A0ABW1ZVZ8_9GAMM
MATASHAAIILTLEPVWTAILGVFWLDERMGALQLAGCTLIFLALLINRWRWLLQRPGRDR